MHDHRATAHSNTRRNQPLRQSGPHSHSERCLTNTTRTQDTARRNTRPNDAHHREHARQAIATHRIVTERASILRPSPTTGPTKGATTNISCSGARANTGCNTPTSTGANANSAHPAHRNKLARQLAYFDDPRPYLYIPNGAAADDTGPSESEDDFLTVRSDRIGEWLRCGDDDIPASTHNGNLGQHIGVVSNEYA